MTKLLIGMTGSISVLTMPTYLLEIRKHFTDIKIIMTHSATQFIPKESFHIFTEGVYSSEFPLSKDNKIHVELARWADLFIILPASGHVFAQAAHGFADTLLSATILAYRKKIIFFPNMNSAMWENKALQRNVSTLCEDGHIIVPPVEKLGLEYSSKKMEVNHILLSAKEVAKLLKKEKK